METFRDWRIWQQAIGLATHIYNTTRTVRGAGRHHLTSDMRRAAMAIPSSIALGSSRASPLDFKRSMTLAVGSLYELQTQLLIAKDIGYLDQTRFDALYGNARQLEATMLSFHKAMEKVD